MHEAILKYVYNMMKGKFYTHLETLRNAYLYETPTLEEIISLQIVTQKLVRLSVCARLLSLANRRSVVSTICFDSRCCRTMLYFHKLFSLKELEKGSVLGKIHLTNVFLQ